MNFCLVEEFIVELIVLTSGQIHQTPLFLPLPDVTEVTWNVFICFHSKI